MWVDGDLAAFEMPSRMVRWPYWFTQFVLLGRELKSLPLKLDPSQNLTVALAVPSARLVGAAIALGLVGGSGRASRSRFGRLTLDQAALLEPGEFVRVIEGISGLERADGSSAVVFGGRVRTIHVATNRTEIAIDTASQKGVTTKRYALGYGDTQFQRSSYAIGPSRSEIAPISRALSHWVAGDQYVPFMTDASHDLTWIGHLARIEDTDLRVAISRGSADPVESIEMQALIRPRSNSTECSGWRTVVRSARSDPLDLAAEETSKVVTLLDGNSAVSRHLSLSDSRITVCVVDTSDRVRQADAVQAIADRRRWALPVAARDMKWSAPSGTQWGAIVGER